MENLLSRRKEMCFGRISQTTRFWEFQKVGLSRIQWTITKPILHCCIVKNFMKSLESFIFTKWITTDQLTLPEFGHISVPVPVVLSHPPTWSPGTPNSKLGSADHRWPHDYSDWALIAVEHVGFGIGFPASERVTPLWAFGDQKNIAGWKMDPDWRCAVFRIENWDITLLYVSLTEGIVGEMFVNRCYGRKWIRHSTVFCSNVDLKIESQSIVVMTP